MIEQTIVVENEVGLHARPAALFVQTARLFDCDVRIFCNGKEANAKSILKVLSLGVTQGTGIRLVADGSQEQEAIDALTCLVKENFPEPKQPPGTQGLPSGGRGP